MSVAADTACECFSIEISTLVHSPAIGSIVFSMAEVTVASPAYACTGGLLMYEKGS